MSTETMVVYDTENYRVELDTTDKEGLWYHIVNKEYNVVESKESLKPQALVYCEQFNQLLESQTHKRIADNMTSALAGAELEDLSTQRKAH